ncbi:MAG: GlsB/YeaQ/YmgE family stress response membrane protein [Deltaproteobacteria bacterium]|nr:GlsB/YeaQ/YmgE family stress response membrane protein [Deltaproteobacteria bacterium]
MSAESVLIILLVGAVAGWLAGLAVQGVGFGLLGDIVIGILGAFIGSWILRELNVGMPGGPIVAAILTAFIGAVALLLVIILLRRIFFAARV